MQLPPINPSLKLPDKTIKSHVWYFFLNSEIGQFLKEDLIIYYTKIFALSFQKILKSYMDDPDSFPPLIDLLNRCKQQLKYSYSMEPHWNHNHSYQILVRLFEYMLLIYDDDYRKEHIRDIYVEYCIYKNKKLNLEMSN